MEETQKYSSEQCLLLLSEPKIQGPAIIWEVDTWRHDHIVTAMDPLGSPALGVAEGLRNFAF